MNIIPWWMQAIGVFALFGGLWVGVHKVEEHYREQGRVEIRAAYEKKALEAKKIVRDIEIQRDAANKSALRVSEETIQLKGKVNGYETNYGSNLIAQLRSRLRPSTNSPSGGVAGLPDTTGCVDVAARAIDTAINNYRTSESNADKLDQLQGWIETDRAAYYKALNAKDTRTPTDAPQRVAKRLEELRTQVKILSNKAP